jgi:4-hydroxybenzoate polyprenyltransferase
MIYAFQDITDDTKTDLKSTAVFFRGYTKPFLWTCLVALVGLLCAHGYLLQSGIGFIIIAAGGSLGSLGAMLAMVNLSNPSSCWW